MPRAKSIVGQKFGRLTVTSRAPSQIQNTCTRSRWHAVCQCGKKVVASGHHLRAGQIRSCGCLVVDTMTKLSTRHGEFKNGKWSPEYSAWCSIKRRCLRKKDPGYPEYGGRGIGIHRPWINSFVRFLKHVGRRPTKSHSIDRIKNDVGYVPGNLRWATRKQQQRNTRRNRVIFAFGKRKTLIEWSETYGLLPETISFRIRRGWNPEVAVTLPAIPPNLRRVGGYGN